MSVVRRALLIGLLSMIGAATHGQQVQVHVDPRANPWTSLKLLNGEQRFHFAVVSDRTGRARPGIFEDAMGKLNLLQPQFVINVGDLIEGYTEDEAELDNQWARVDAMVGRLEMPFFFVPGNHDITNPVQVRKWQQRFGRTFYHFVYKDVLFLCLSTEEPSANISAEQIAYFRDVIKQHPNSRWTFAFMHEPLWTSNKQNGWSEIEALLKGRPHTVIAGHVHQYTKYLRNDHEYIVLSTTGGGRKGSEDRNPQMGAMDHVMWITMTETRPRLVNLELDGMWDTDVRTERGAALMKGVLQGEAITVSPILVEGDSFEAAKVQIRLKNPADIPARMRGALTSGPGIQLMPASFDETIEPGATRVLEAEIRTASAIPLRSVPATTLAWLVDYAPPDTRPVQITGRHMIAPDQRLPIPAGAQALKVDGDLADWGELPVTCDMPASPDKASQWAGPKDLSYRMATRSDERCLYIAIQTTDDSFYGNVKKTPWDQDGVEIRLDARPEPQRSQGRGRAEFKDILVLSMTPGESGTPAVLYEQQLLPPDVQVACRRTASGHATEVAIPVAYLNEKQGWDWDAVRLNVVVNDVDGPDGEPKHIWWRPDWRDSATFAGSGTFVRVR